MTSKMKLLQEKIILQYTPARCKDKTKICLFNEGSQQTQLRKSLAHYALLRVSVYNRVKLQ
jgi:hypothetical protein